MRKSRVIQSCLLLFSLCVQGGSSAAGSIASEKQDFYLTRVLRGIGVGVDCVLEFAGYFDNYDFYEPDDDDDDDDDETTMKVAIVGHPRTGRNSLESALEIIGNYRVWTGTETYEYSILYRDLMNGNLSADEFYEVMEDEGYNATTRLWTAEEFDWLKRSPHVKVIMTVKDDVDKWVESFMIYAQYYTYEFDRPYKWFTTVQNVMPFYLVQQYMMTNGEPEKLWDHEHMKGAYHQLIHKYSSNFNQDRLLLYNVKDGWGPLCNFLGVPIPDVPFPRRNDYVVKQFELLTVKFVAWIWPILALLPLVLLRLVIFYLAKTKPISTDRSAITQSSPIRYTSIDILRGLSIVEMVLVHYVRDLSGFRLGKVLAFFGAPLFLLLSGISYHVSFASQLRRKAPKDTRNKRTMTRSLFLVGVGILLYWSMLDVAEAFTCDILIMSGMAQLCLLVASGMQTDVIVHAIALIILATPALQDELEAEDYWDEETRYFEFDDDISLEDLFLSHFVAGYFPLIPYVVYPLAGMVVGRLLYSSKTTFNERSKLAWNLALWGALVYCGCSFLVIFSREYPEYSHVFGYPFLRGWKIYVASFEYTVGKMGSSVFFVGIASLLLDKEASGKWSSSRLVPLQTLGQASLSIYVFHYACLIWPMRAHALWKGEPWTDKHKEEPYFAVHEAVGIAILFLVVTWLLLTWMKGKGVHPPLEGAMKTLCG